MLTIQIEYVNITKCIINNIDRHKSKLLIQNKTKKIPCETVVNRHQSRKLSHLTQI